ncbi:MAG: antibiotic biosynthesis monooxygenase family protein [Actinomycetota bacterium]|mgnify:FL=1|jgi:quinol monooxygenase YgiN|nr:antibiotic biosynthesis monooxygenase [Acidimicrobiales bacterium]|tara:strand:+ start:317 stop:610 length:294 start_codon:yes stop_codon:yes gene_type:complete
MSQTVHVVFPCQEGKGPELIEILREALPDTRAYEGCESIEVYSDDSNPDTVVLWEKFALKENHQSYLQWRMDTGLPELLAPVLAGNLQVTYLDSHDA